MKKLQDNLPARIAASVILTVSFLLTLLSTAGIVLLASYQAYNDGGAQLRTSYLHAAGVQEYYDHVEPVLEGLVHEPQSYQNYLNSLNVHVDVKTTDGTTVFSNAKEGETSLLEGPFSYTFTTGETKLWKNTFSDAEKAQRALERFPYQIEDYEIEAPISQARMPAMPNVVTSGSCTTQPKATFVEMTSLRRASAPFRSSVGSTSA